MAGLFDAWRRGEGEEALYTFTILTTESSERLQWCVAAPRTLAPPTPGEQERALKDAAYLIDRFLQAAQPHASIAAQQRS